nr:hypothetical protein [Tanacetum cinerariifolium]
MMLYKALEKSMNHDHIDELLKDLVEARRKKKNRHDSSKTPLGSLPHQLPPPPPLAAEYTTWMTTDTRLIPSVSLILEDLHMDDDTAPDEQVHSSDDEDIRNAHILKASALASTYTPLPENSLLAQTGDMAIFMDLFCKRQGITKLKPQDLEGPTFELVKVFHPNVIHLQVQMEECYKLLTDSVDESIIRYNVSKPLPLGGPLGQVTIQSDFFFNKDLEYIRYGSKGGRPALSISKMKATYYLDVGLKKIVPDQMWIEEECKYDIAAIAVRTYMRILSVVKIEVFSMYRYDYMKKIVLRRVDLNEHIIAKRDFKYMYPTTGFEYKHDFTIIDSPRAVTFRDKYGVQMIMQFNEIHKFSDGTLHQIDEALDYRVKEFKVNRMNPGLNTRFWTRKAVDRSKEFMFSIWKRLKTRRIFCNLESFVGGRVREGDYRLLQQTE